MKPYRPTQPTPSLEQRERDACGVGFVARIDGKRTHELVEKGIEALIHLEHRGACGCDPETGDGAGVTVHIPHEFLEDACGKLGFRLPQPGGYGAGMVFLPVAASLRQRGTRLLEKAISESGLKLLGWRDVPVDERHCGRVAQSTRPHIAQIFVVPEREISQDELERRLFVARRVAERRAAQAGGTMARNFYVASLSCRTMVYKGMLMSSQLPGFFPDLVDPRFKSAIALVHSRFSTNTLPTWRLAHPFRYLAHNGEINTIRGNTNWMSAREKLFESPLFGDDIAKLVPIIEPGQSDSAVFDNALELLCQTGRALPHAVMMMIPEAWEKHESMPEEKKVFYRYHGCLMEPWDGPASIAFTDGRSIGAVLDRNGLRPSRYLVTRDGLVVMASETGVLDIPARDIVLKDRLQPGRMFYVDLEQRRIIEDGEVKHQMSVRRPYAAWLRESQVELDALPAPARVDPYETGDALERQQKVHGYSLEDLRMIITPMALNGQEPVGSMGTDTPLACLSDQPQLLYNYFKQLFAQVTNPPIDSIREDLVMSLGVAMGRQSNLFDESPAHCRQLAVGHPILTNEELARIRAVDANGIRSRTISTLYEVRGGGAALARALDRMRAEASRAIEEGLDIIILSDRGSGAQSAPVPALLAVGAVHHHLIRTGMRTRVGIAVESGEPREVMHFCLLFGYGASVVNPYLALATLAGMAGDGELHGHAADEAIAHYIKAAEKGVLKTMSKMGISTLGSYRGAQIFEAIGLADEVIDSCFTWTASRIKGVGLDVIAEEAAMRHRRAYEPATPDDRGLVPGGQYQWRRRGEFHLFNPQTVAKLQHAVRSADYATFKKYSHMVNEQSRNLCTLRSMLVLKKANRPIPLEDVEPASDIVKRFKTGAMSFGSISKEAHENLAIAMNRIGGKSNTGEGGEDPARFKPDANGDLRRSAIKQVASGRFGVTINYLVNALEIQIKMAQGAKPGEGGQLPGHKVDEFIAKTRYATPGVGLISPPPHHDIYSIEDLAQLIHDLKNANNQARISVKLVAEVGVGTIAAGVSKAKADVVLISGHDGGTGASPLSSIKHAGIPWELGLSETQQVLVENDLRSRIRVETDGQLKTGRDVAIAALLGADEFGFATAALVSSGCIMMRKCHLNTCPVGVATQDKELRKKFSGLPDHVINFMMFVAEELREIMAYMGFRTVAEMTGRVDRLDTAVPQDHWKAKHLDLWQILARPKRRRGVGISGTGKQDHGLSKALDIEILELAKPALEHRRPVELNLAIKNTNRTVCTMLSSELTRRYGEEGLPPYTIRINFRGSAGQSFAAFLARGIALRVVGDANDYFCKGISGGHVVIVPPEDAGFVPEDNIIIGNVSLYGATGGEVFIRGRAGERFCVRNSGATAVVEGVGDHGCEYMTRGLVVVLGPQGRNFAAGMSGGAAYVLDEDGTFRSRCNLGMVDLLPVDNEEDQRALRLLVQRHQQYTESAVATRLLAHWDDALGHFLKVLPTEYRKVLEQMHLDSETMRLASI
jgi:glutamate synthase domain-containing protein 2/glutamate synthase domain-containing protein 1/glutamate synthase domain-containing protein 3